MPTSSFDIAIIGAGAAGLHLALAMQKDPFFIDKRILIVEKSDKDLNDRTWCFWEKGTGQWDAIVQKNWSLGQFYFGDTKIPLSLEPYKYKMLRALDFYELAKTRLYSDSQFEWVKDDVKALSYGMPIKIHGNTTSYSANLVFDSRIPEEFFHTGDGYTRLIQHFKGWFIKASSDVFEPDNFTLMDFRLVWPRTTSFTYVLPINKREALIEFTFFSHHVMKDEEYNSMLKEYIQGILNISDFEIMEEEFGTIPMSDFPFEKYASANHIRIGTGGGWVKPSTGYSFKNCERNSEQIIKNIKKGKPIHTGIIKPKHRLYDSLFLDVLSRQNERGPALFHLMYSKFSVQKIFSFLDDQTSIMEDISIMVRFPWHPFFYSLLKKLCIRWNK